MAACSQVFLKQSIERGHQESWETNEAGYGDNGRTHGAAIINCFESNGLVDHGLEKMVCK